MNFILRGVFNFDTYAAAILGTNFRNVTVLAIMDANTANRELDIQAMHLQVFPTLPTGTPNDPFGYDYVKVKTPSGQTTILGMAWINAATVVQVQSNTITAVISGVSASDASRVRDALVQNGFNNLAITVQ